MGNLQGVFWREDKPRSLPPMPAAPHLCLCFASNCGADKLFLAWGVFGWTDYISLSVFKQLMPAKPRHHDN